MPQRSKPFRLFPLLRLLLLTLIFTGIFCFLEYVIELRHELSVFVSFLVLPFIYLYHKERKSTGGLRLGGLDTGLLEGIGIYLVFAGYVFLYYLSNRGFFERYDKSGGELVVSLFYTALNVMSVDFFTKRFIQLPLGKSYGPKVAVGLQTAVWLTAHYPESLWLGELMGGVGVWVFLGFTGLITGISYERTKNVSGQMVGHVLLNVIVRGLARL